MKKKLYYVSELLKEDVPYPTGFRDLRVYEIINGELIEFYNIEHPMEDYALEILRDYLLERFNNSDEITFDENDYEFIEL
jgi:hypothetical protein